MEPSRYSTWSEVTTEELTAFFGFMVLMGLVPLPSLADYWSTDPTFHYARITDRISRDRFLEVLKYLHFVDNRTLPKRGENGFSKLGKIQPIIGHINECCMKVYNLGREVSIDEAMIPFKGRSTIKQYMPMKPTKRGIKVWALADSNTGFVAKVDVYTGKKSGQVEHGLGASVVLHLTDHLQQRYRYYNKINIIIQALFTGITMYTVTTTSTV